MSGLKSGKDLGHHPEQVPKYPFTQTECAHMNLLAQMPPVDTAAWWPFVCLLAGMLTVVTGIAWLKCHAFLSLMLAAMVVGLTHLLQPGEAPVLQDWLNAFNDPMMAFGGVAGQIAWLIALASVIGMCMMASGASERIVRTLVQSFGARRAPWALMASGFVLGIPVFFDTVFFLLIPLARGLALRTGHGYAASIMAISSGAVITHTLVPPTPGPLFMAETLGLPLATGIWAGLITGLPVVVAAFSAGWLINRHLEITPPNQATDKTPCPSSGAPSKEPGLMWSLLPVLLPVFLIGGSSILALGMDVTGPMQGWRGLLTLLGHKQVAMTLSAAIALHMLVCHRPMSRNQLSARVAPALETAAIIILITAAGGAFGAMIKAAGIGEAIGTLARALGLNLILVAWITSALMKTAQGSGTVAMITTTGIMASVVGEGGTLGFHPLYLYLAIGFGSGMISWMNDSGFWVVCRLSGLSEKETLRTWTLCLALISLLGLALTLAGSVLWPMA